MRIDVSQYQDEDRLTKVIGHEALTWAGAAEWLKGQGIPENLISPFRRNFEHNGKYYGIRYHLEEEQQKKMNEQKELSSWASIKYHEVNDDIVEFILMYLTTDNILNLTYCVPHTNNILNNSKSMTDREQVTAILDSAMTVTKGYSSAVIQLISAMFLNESIKETLLQGMRAEIVAQ